MTTERARHSERNTALIGVALGLGIATILPGTPGIAVALAAGVACVALSYGMARLTSGSIMTGRQRTDTVATYSVATAIGSGIATALV